jgi:NADH-quinone oxidoreductase subunit L
VLAYSTISQLGYMVAALGIGAWIAAAFHLINHAFFKALLFMGSGSVIHAMEHGEHHAHGDGEHEHHEEPDGLVMDYCAPPNDIQRMGGLLHRLPVTAITMAIAGLSLAGFPLFTAGFWSKDEIISEAWHGMQSDPYPLFVLLLLLAGAFLTAFYTARMWFLTFWGQPRTAAAEHSGTGSLRKQWVVWWNRRRWSANNKLTQEYISKTDRLSANQMEFPLVVLAFFAIFAGYIGIHEDIFGSNPLHDFLGRTVARHTEAIGFDIVPMLLSIIIVLSGLGLAYWVYAMKPLAAGETDPTEKALGPGIWQMLQNRFYIDILYRRYLVQPFEWASVHIVIQAIDKETIDGVLETLADGAVWTGEACKRFNRVVIDGVGDGIPKAIGDFAGWFRQIQTGRVQQYLLFVTLALLALGTLLILQVR